MEVETFMKYKHKIDSMIATQENIASRKKGLSMLFSFFKIDRLIRRRAYIHKILYDYLLYQETDELTLDKFKKIMIKHEVAEREGRHSKYKNIMLQKYNEIYSAWTEIEKINKNTSKWHIRIMDKIWFILHGMWGVSVD